jgi:hypothetical protein
LVALQAELDEFTRSYFGRSGFRLEEQ